MYVSLQLPIPWNLSLIELQFAHIPTKTFYNGAKSSDFIGPTANLKGSLHYWAAHGIAGRGVLLDYWGYTQANGIKYDPFSKSSPPPTPARKNPTR